MAWDHHPTLWDLRYEHGFAEWDDQMVTDNYPKFIGPDGQPDWLALHRRDHEGGAHVHVSDEEAAEQTGPHGDRGRPPYGRWTVS
jgi:hypothetical protein